MDLLLEKGRKSAAYNCLLDFFAVRRQTYNSDLLDTSAVLAALGMSCGALIGVNFNTNKRFARERSRANDYFVLRQYAKMMKELENRTLQSDGLERLAFQTAGSLVHEAFYTVLNGRCPDPNMGIDNEFARSQALEMFALATLNCPNCGGPLGFEHLQHRGDLYCPSINCLSDIDVKSSVREASSHCLKWNRGEIGSERTRFVAYPQSIGGGRTVFYVLDCGFNTVIGTSDSFSSEDISRVASRAMEIVRPYAAKARDIRKKLFC